jgi:hypothetical protein
MNIFKDKILSGFVLRLLIWLPLTFTAWYLLAAYLIVPVGWFTSLWLDVLASGKLESIGVSGKMLALETNIQVAAPDGRMGYLLLEINPLVYCWNLPLLTAMTLAAGFGNFLGVRLMVAYIGLLPFQAWGVSFDFLKLTVLQYGPDISQQMGYGPLGREVVALGYQFGFLMLPVISASAIWIIMHRWFIRNIIAENKQ